MTVLEAPHEAIPRPSGYEPILTLQVTGDGLLGQLAISQFGDMTVGHDFESFSEDPMVAARLMKRARTRLKELGVTHLHAVTSDPRLMEFYFKQGFDIQYVCYHGEI